MIYLQNIIQLQMALWNYNGMEHNENCMHIPTLRSWSVDSSNGGPNDVPTLGPMEK